MEALEFFETPGPFHPTTQRNITEGFILQQHSCENLIYLMQSIHKRMVRLLLQLNTNYDDYILQLDGAPPIFTEMYDRFS